MSGWLDRVLSTLIGDYRHFSIERRLFNTISLLNTVVRPVSHSFASRDRDSIRGFLLPLAVQGLLPNFVLAVHRSNSRFPVYQLSFQRRVCRRGTLLLNPCAGYWRDSVRRGAKDHRRVRGIRCDNCRAFFRRARSPRLDHSVLDSNGANAGCPQQLSICAVSHRHSGRGAD